MQYENIHPPVPGNLTLSANQKSSGARSFASFPRIAALAALDSCAGDVVYNHHA